MNQTPILSFEFADSNGKIQPLTFQNPIRLIQAHTIEEVIPCLQLVEEAVKDGFYAGGFLSYESAPAFDSAYKVKDGNKMPFLWFGIFREPQQQPLTSTNTFSLSEWKSSVGRDEYNQSISSIKHAIESGNTYQTNYTIRLNSHFRGDDIAFFEKLKVAQASNYCAYLNTGEHSILSASPELFFHLQGDFLTTRPMKGTIQRGKTTIEDEANASWLYHSEKNRAENVMIVDLLRNDLSIIAELGTVSVPKLFEIEQYPTVHQMTSSVTAKVANQTTLVDIFKALFPCGSITGAPKVSTMGIITDLEKAPREVYCGTIGFITPEKEAIFNVPIRTVLIEHQSGQATYGVGGGITWDSTSEGEYQEILTKASFLKENKPVFQLLESMLLDKGSYFLLEEHLQRLKNSAQYFGYPCDIADVKRALDIFSKKNGNDVLKVRLLLAKNGEIITEGNPIVQPGTALKVMLANKPIDKNSPFVYHKTTNREVYTPFQLEKPAEVYDVLLWNEESEITEFTNGNVVFEIDGSLWTPPIDSGLLAGTFREVLLRNGEIHEKTVTVGDIHKSTKIWFINSVRKWLEVQLISH
ncbi:para-aminobenzoate synthase component II [Neobacillus bataviensis LMG 21833]|uniref:Para-aminobenzoate synthase component II n=1 Tax=Neobacillus bataviensis LMG 21833 TaxID=1117379 RepID=K6C8Z6_9BACI|nr:aminodeoxychorismate synthase component I [Neobacillus bataviensis]EKN67575.1 para-aminobenzoate synthase component II [Neobacillus bataviensis LMG 21833]